MCCADQAAVKTNGMRMFISPIIIIEDFFLFVASGTVREKINKKNLKWTQCSFSCSLCLSPLRLSTCRPCKQNKKEHTYKWFFYHYFGCFFFSSIFFCLLDLCCRIRHMLYVVLPASVLLHNAHHREGYSFWHTICLCFRYFCFILYCNLPGTECLSYFFNEEIK